MPACASRRRNGTTWRVVTSSATASMQSRVPEAISRSLLPVIAFAEPEADAALFDSHFSPPSVPVHGAMRISRVHAICIRGPVLVMLILFTVDATMKPRELLTDSSADVGRPPGQVVA